MFLPQNTNLVSPILDERSPLYTSPHLPNVRVHRRVSFIRRKFWASKVMYRGLAADILALQGFCAILGIPSQMPQKGDYTHLADFLRLGIMKKVVLFGRCCPAGWLLSENSVSEALSGSRAVHTCCCSYCCMAGDLARADQAQLSKIYCHRLDVNLSRIKVCSVDHVLRKRTRGDRAVYLHRAGPGAMGYRRC